MRQALYILQLPQLELKRFLQEKMIENPVLEEADDSSEDVIDNLIQNEQTADEYFDSDNDNTSYSQEAQKKQAFKESLVSYTPSLQEHLLQQLSLSGCTPPEYKIGEEHLVACFKYSEYDQNR